MKAPTWLAVLSGLLSACSLMVELNGPADDAPDRGIDAQVVDASLDAVSLDATAEDANLPGDMPMPDAGERCRQGAERSIPCGLNGRGREQQVCDEDWISEGCVDSDECADGNAETQDCGRNGRGMETRMCVGGRWGAFNCADPDACTDGAHQDRVCQSTFLEGRDCVDGQWTMWSDCACETGAERERNCGLNGRGEQSQACGENGVWSPWAACEDPDECVDGAIEDRPCARIRIERRQCEDGDWSSWSECMLRPED